MKKALDGRDKLAKNLSTVHGLWTTDFNWAMKSQDILLLLKLSALEYQAQTTPTAHGVSANGDPDQLVATDEGTDARDADTDTSVSLPLNPEFDPYSVRGLSSSTGISKSEVSNALARCYANGLAKPQRHGGGPLVNRRGLEEFLSYGIRFVFPVQATVLTRGIPTGLTAPIFHGLLRSAGDHSPVWPDPQGSTLGLAVEPLYKTVTTAIRNDETLYRLLATVDSIRLGQPRERKLAVAHLHDLLSF
ncbi:hypothetical protein [Bordetella sp. LUAb4]|uniref:hypothetical protein n=1 Tax=Bordetella sp. LUAb4 TaxID=2843195 RepID=UPI001E6364CE|nr:hypothetical protein [Bordetella sp. LUAb4]